MLLSDGVVFSTAVTKPLEVQTDPASEGDQHFWRFAESEIARQPILGLPRSSVRRVSRLRCVPGMLGGLEVKVL